MASVDLRYARALEAVVLEQKLDRVAVQAQIEDFQTAFEANPALREVLEDPSIPQEQKVRVLNALAGKLGMSSTVRNFLATVTGHERLHELRTMLDAFVQMADRDAGVAEAEVTSARPLDGEGRRAIEDGIVRLTGEAQVRATYREDPGLLGGAVIRVGSTVYDGSVRGQLEQMKRRLTATEV